jgi:hypothetical protein
VEEAAVVDATGDVLVEEAVLVLAEAVQDLPLRFCSSPELFFRLFITHDQLIQSGTLSGHCAAIDVKFLPSGVVPGLSVGLEQLVDLVRCQRVWDGLGVLGEYLFELLRNKPAQLQ